ncbi:threonine/serine exporter family protein [Crassaminicella thermophila]|uniref:Threonine/serine exporter family protein n=1 Tax=Crassaminicella thermophila TaxID=2599308 RepID=A0A5C0SDP8_CRATE|nr:threonine/serine exporter family protein [Crassaminicella thermophila]QEK12082.1 threonine/serine exporter family protein [Crassaminicella thermophila]
MRTKKKNILTLALYAGEIMLKNGAETYRVEDTIIRICKAYHIPYVESFVTPTGIFISVDSNDDTETNAFIKRIKTRTIDLNKVSQVNNFSRKLATSYISVEEGMEILRNIDNLPKYSKLLKAISAGIASAFFAVLLGATYNDIICSFFISIFVYIAVSFVENLDSNLFIQNAIGGTITALLAILSINIHLGINIDKIIISSIMILVPGVAITNAVRDYISGDLLSGTARSGEAIIIAVAIAVGVGTVMNFWLYIFGGIL